MSHTSKLRLVGFLLALGLLCSVAVGFMQVGQSPGVTGGLSGPSFPLQGPNGSQSAPTYGFANCTACGLFWLSSPNGLYLTTDSGGHPVYFNFSGSGQTASMSSTALTLGLPATNNVNLVFGFGKGQHVNTQAAQADSWGVATCSSSTATVSFTTAYTSTPAIIVSDETTTGGARVSAKSNSSFTITCTGASDVVDYFTGGNPN